MEVNGRTSTCNEISPFENSIPPNEQKELVENNSSGTSTAFVNHAAVAWDEIRGKWIGNSSRRSERTPKDPIISWSMTYDDLRSTGDPFPQPIPLSEMVDFLVDIWHDEDLLD